MALKNTLLVHNVDVASTEEYFQYVGGTFLDIQGKAKVILNRRCELMRKMRKERHHIPKGDNSYELLPVCYTLTSSERYLPIDALKRIKVTVEYTSSISRCITFKDSRYLVLTVMTVMCLYNNSYV